MRNIISNIKLVYNNKVGLFIAIFKTKLNSIRQLWIKLENSNYLNIKLLTFIIFLYLLSFCVHCESIIMLFNFDYQTALTIYITIIGATTGILGITITVLVIAVQFLTEKYDEFASDALLSNKKLRDIITCYVLAIILPLLTIIFLNQNHALQSSDYFRIVFCVLLFSFVTIKLFAQLPKIVKSTNTIEILKNLDEKINKETLYEFIHLHKKSTLLLLEHKEKNIINTISKIGVKAIQKDDEFTLESLIEFRLHKFSKLLNDSIDNPKEFYRSNNVIETYFFYFIKPLLDRALDNKNERLLQLLFIEIKDINIMVSNRSYLLIDDLRNINGYLINIIGKELIQNNLNRSLKILLDTVEEIFVVNIKNINKPIDIKILCSQSRMPNGEEIIYPTTEENRKKLENDERGFEFFRIQEIINNFNNLVETAIINRDKNLVQSMCGIYIRSILFKLITKTGYTLSQMQSILFISTFITNLKNNFIKSVEHNLYSILEINLFFPVMISTISNYRYEPIGACSIKNYVEALKILSEKYEIIDGLFAKRGLGKITLYEIDEACREFFNHFDTFKDDLIFILDCLESILVNIKKRNGTNIDLEHRIVLDQIKSIQQMRINSNINDIVIIGKINSLLST